VSRSQPHYASTRANRFIGRDILDPAIDFLALAASPGVPTHRIDRATEIAPALEAAISSGAPNLDRDQPLLSSGALSVLASVYDQKLPPVVGHSPNHPSLQPMAHVAEMP
jgi:hypothetical protein